MNKLNQKASNLRPWRGRLFREVNIMTCASQCYKSSRWHRYCRTIVRFVHCIDGFFFHIRGWYPQKDRYVYRPTFLYMQKRKFKQNKQKEQQKERDKRKTQEQHCCNKKKQNKEKKNNLLLFVQRLSLIWLYCIELFIC